MAIAHVGTTTGNTTSDPLTLASHVVSGADPALVCKVSYKSNSAGVVTGITFNGTENFVKLTEDKNGNAVAELWYLASPTVTTADVVISHSSAVRCVGSVSTYSGVDGTNPFRAAANAIANGTSANPTVDVVALSGEMAVDVVCNVSAGPFAATASQTQRHNDAATGGGTDTRGAGQEKASTGATESMTWTIAAENWAMAAGALQEPAASVEVTATVVNMLMPEQNAVVKEDISLTSVAVAMLMTEQLAALKTDINFTAGTQSVTLSAQNATVKIDEIVAAILATVSLTTAAATLKTDVNVAGNTATLLMTEQGAAVVLGVQVAAGTVAVTLTPANAATNIATAVASVLATLSMPSSSASLNVALGMSAGASSITLAAQAAVVTLGAMPDIAKAFGIGVNVRDSLRG